MEYQLEKKEIESCDSCCNELMFEIGNGKSSYAVSIEAILTCLQIAESQGAIPQINDDWWLQVSRRYNGIDRNFTLKLLKDIEQK